LADVEYMFARSGELRAAPSISVFEPGFLRTTLAWQRGGRLPPGAMVKLYFGGELEFGLRPTVTALEAYLELLEPSGLPWSVAVLGGDVVGCGMAELAIRRGGHVRVGLEDYAGPGEPSNLDLLRAAVALIAGLGHAPASTAQARQILGVPPATRLRLSACRSRCGLRLPGLCPACEPGSARDVEVAGDSVAIAGQELNALGHPVTFFLQRGEHLRSRFQTVTDQLDQLYADSASSGRVMALALHPFAIGQPFRAKYLDQALEYITGHPGVWLTTSDEIAAHFARVRPQVQQGR
jgi:hypothetical protein